jgi:hypothetical protein
MEFGLEDFDDLPAVDNSKAPERLLLEDGEYALEIKAVTKLDDGRVEIRLAHADKGYSWVFAKLPLDVEWGRRILSTLRKALGMSREAWAAMDPSELVGRVVKTRIYQKVGTKGGTFVNVGEFIAGAVTKSDMDGTYEKATAWEKDERKPAARTPAAKVAAAGQGGDEDSLPF